jgi:hypothetical protein
MNSQLFYLIYSKRLGNIYLILNPLSYIEISYYWMIIHKKINKKYNQILFLLFISSFMDNWIIEWSIFPWIWDFIISNDITISSDIIISSDIHTPFYSQRFQGREIDYDSVDNHWSKSWYDTSGILYHFRYEISIPVEIVRGDSNDL